MLTIDGSFGEGGGQIVRSSLALSLVTGVPIQIDNIRAGRKKSGLMRQHLTAVLAAAEVGGAAVRGASLGSSRLDFEPAGVSCGDYQFRVGTAGSATLVLQTVLPALLTADGPSTLVLEGGTHNPFAPPFDFLARTYLPLINRMGPSVTAVLDRPGFYPAGGGRVTVTIESAERLAGFDLLERGEIVGRRGTAVVAKLPRHIAQRECDTLARRLDWDDSCCRVEERTDTAGPGNVVLAELECEHITEVFTGFGQRGVRAEDVARNVVREIRRYLKAGVPVGAHLADQWMLPLGISAHHGGGGGAFRTLDLTQHAATHIDILQRFLDVTIDVEKHGRDDHVVRVEKRA